MINLFDFLSGLPGGPDWAIGESRRYNHEECPAGTDTRERLYIKKIDNFNFVCHCFNCGDSGHWLQKDRVLKIAEAIKETRYSDHVEKQPNINYYDMLEKGFLYGHECFSVEALVWLNKYEFNKQVCDDYGIKTTVLTTHPSYGSNLVIPLTNTPEGPKGYVTRVFNHGVPKYIQRTGADNLNYGLYEHLGKLDYGRKELYIVEDCISAIKIIERNARANVRAKIDALALCGLNVTDAVKSYIAGNNYNAIIVWLDNDEAANRALGNLVKNIKQVANISKIYGCHTRNQPKEVSFDYDIYNDLSIIS